jgi:putative flippase GtrA
VRRLFAHRPLRYLVVGGWNTVFGVGFFTGLYLAAGHALGYVAVLAVAQVVAVLQAHATQRLIVWRTHGPYVPELLRFSVVYVALYFANLALLALCVDGLGLPVLPSQWTLTAILVLPAYVASRAWAFRLAPTDPADPARTTAYYGEPL